ncbi:glycosyltransferase family 25 protein [Gigaspora margarita]|uniref:Glycosyltransferase family 25 protein n=1 Tax=Gigaspora margarita TaxID=4874 RepID=A0A8H3WY75_GIGMA|nr:glycosyltransferase family 25 protein [Gigaspora margarita]
MSRLIYFKKLIIPAVIILVVFMYISLWSLKSQESLLNSTKNFPNKNLNQKFLGFDHIYVINISSLPGTYEKLKSVENKLSLEFEICPAVSQFDNEALNEFNQNSLQPSQKANYISHYKVYQLIAQHKFESTLVLEDDIDFELNISSIMTDIHQTLPADWEILYLGHCSDWERNSNEYLSDYNDGLSNFKLFKSKRPYCTHAYAVSYAGALKLLRKLNTITPLPIDLELVNMIKTNEISSYTIIPPVISRLRFEKSTDLYPGKNTLNLFSLKNSTLHSLGFNYILNNTLGFSHIYLITLKNRVDRRKKIEFLAKKLNLNIEIFPAITGEDKDALNELERVDDLGLIPTQIACYVSHYKVYQSIINHGYESALILEDDVDFELNIESVITNAFKVLPSNWDLFYLGYCGYQEQNGHFVDGQNNSAAYKLYRSTYPYCTHGYAVSRAGAHKLVKMLTPISTTLDDRLAQLNSFGDINSYSIVPLAMIQWRSPSNPSSVYPGGATWFYYYLKNSALEFYGLIKESNNTLGFDHIYVIRHPDQSRKKQLSRITDTMYLVFDYVDISQDENEISNKFKFKQSKLEESQKNSYLTHYNIYRSIVDNGFGSALILEDNSDLELRTSSIMFDIHRILPIDWEILFLDHCDNTKSKSNETLSSYKIFKTEKPHCLFAYAVSYSGAVKLLEKLDKPTKFTIDIELANLIQSKKLISYTLSPPIIVPWNPDENVSDINSLKNSTIKFANSMYRVAG